MVEVDIVTIVSIVLAIFITTAISARLLKQTLNKSLKTDQLKSALSQIGLKNFNAKEWNTLTDYGLKNLISFMAVWKQTSNPLAGFGGMGGMGGIDMSKFLPADIRKMMEPGNPGT